MADYDGKLNILKSMAGSGGGGDSEENNKGVIDAIEIMIENLRKECYAKFGKIDDVD